MMTVLFFFLIVLVIIIIFIIWSGNHSALLKLGFWVLKMPNAGFEFVTMKNVKRS